MCSDADFDFTTPQLKILIFFLAFLQFCLPDSLIRTSSLKPTIGDQPEYKHIFETIDNDEETADKSIASAEAAVYQQQGVG